jgi:hypothetical protein
MLETVHLIRIFLPKDGITWCGALLLAGLLYYYLRESVFSPHGIGLLCALFTIVVILALSVPAKWVTSLALIPPWIRGAFFAAFAYTFVVTLGFAPEITSLRIWKEVLTFSGTAPFTKSNAFGIVAAILAALTQIRYRRLVFHETKVVRGPHIIPHEEAIAITEQQLGPDGKGFLWGAVRLPFSKGTEHFCIVGEPGSGKTKSIQLLQKSVIGSIKPGSNRRAILYDAKRDIISTLANFGVSCPVKTLHPFDRRGYAWDIAADVTNPMVAIEIAHILIPEKAGEHQPYFPNAARALVSGVMESLYRSAPGKWTLRDVVLSLRYSKRVKHLLKSSIDTHYLIEKYLTDKQSDQDVASTIENSMRRLSFVAAGWELAGGKVGLNEWAENGESVLILGRSPLMESTFIELNRAILYRLAQIIRDQPNSDRVGDGRPERQTWIVVDELSEAGKLDGFNALLKEGRSKGACVVLGFQDVHGLEEVYGPRLGKEIIGICRNKAFLRTTDPDTQKYASECFGTQEIELPRVSTSENWSDTSGKFPSSSHSYGESVSSQRLSQPVVLPSQFGNDLHPPSRKKGISGYYLTASVPEPYFANLPGAFIQSALPDIDVASLPEEQSDFIPRFPGPSPNVSLKEWTEEDLKRLNLEKYPQLLETAADEVKPKFEEGWLGHIKNIKR